MKIEAKLHGSTKTYILEGIGEILNIKEGIPFNVFSELGEYLMSGGAKENFGNDIAVGNNFYSPDFVFIEHNDNMKSEKMLNEFRSRFKKINLLSSEKYDNERQIPEVVGTFEYNGKYYLVVYAYNPLTEEINPEKGVYKGVIVNPSKYFEVENEVQNIAKEVGDIL